MATRCKFLSLAASGFLRCSFPYYNPVGFMWPSLTRNVSSRNKLNANCQYRVISVLTNINSENTVHKKLTLSRGTAGRDQSTTTSVTITDQGTECPICSRNLTFTYKDVLLLSQFISPEGNILNRRSTGVCRKQQRKLEKATEISRRQGLIPRKPPALMQQE